MANTHINDYVPIRPPNFSRAALELKGRNKYHDVIFGLCGAHFISKILNLFLYYINEVPLYLSVLSLEGGLCFYDSFFQFALSHKTVPALKDETFRFVGSKHNAAAWLKIIMIKSREVIN